MRWLVAALAVVVLLACTGPSAQATVVVQAAASLSDAFTEIGAAFEAANPDVTVTSNFAGSQSLAAQIIQGAPADVYASASTAQVEAVAEAGLVTGAVRTVATNALAIVVAAGNPFGIDDLADLSRGDLVVVLAAPAVPAGGAAAQALAAAGVEVRPASLEGDVRSVLARVELGEADAGIVYASDLVAADETVEGVAIPPEDNVRVEYPIAVLADAPNPDAARAFVAFVAGPQGQAVLAAHGFGAP